MKKREISRWLPVLTIGTLLLTGSSCMKNLHILDPENSVFFTEEPVLTAVYSSSLEFSVKLNRGAVIHYMVLPAGSPAPSAAEVANGRTLSGQQSLASITLQAGPELQSLGTAVPSMNSSYDVYIIAESIAGLKGLPTAVHKISGSTTGAYSYQGQWGGVGQEPGMLSSPRAVFADQRGMVYVSDSGNNRIQGYDRNGNLMYIIGQSGGSSSSGTSGSSSSSLSMMPMNARFGIDTLSSPYGICQDADGNYYVVDEGNYRIVKYGPNWNFLLSWGSRGDGNGQFNSPAGICVDRQGFVYVADYQNREIQKFDRFGNYITKWGSYGGSEGQFINIRAICADRDGCIYVADEGNDRIQKFDGDGEFILQWGSMGNDVEKRLNGPQGVVSDQTGNIYVIDLDNRVRKFDRSGNFITQWSGQFSGSRGLFVDSRGAVYVCDTQNDRIQVFR